MSPSPRTSLRSTYLYLVCLVTLVLALFAAVHVVRSAVELAWPDPAVGSVQGPYGPDGATRLTVTERDRQDAVSRASARRRSAIDLVGSGAMLVVTGPAYLYHWRRVQEELRCAEAAPAPTDLPV